MLRNNCWKSQKSLYSQRKVVQIYPMSVKEAAGCRSEPKSSFGHSLREGWGAMVLSGLQPARRQVHGGPLSVPCEAEFRGELIVCFSRTISVERPLKSTGWRTLSRTEASLMTMFG